MNPYPVLAIILAIMHFFSFLNENEQIMRGTVHDQETKKPVAYAIVQDLQKKIYTITDSLGHFEVQVANVPSNDSIHIYLPGYQPVYRPILIGKDINVELYKKRYTPTRINKLKGRKKKLGAVYSLTEPPLGCYADSSLEAALYIENPMGKVALIEQISFYIHEEGSYDAPFRIHTYQAKSGFPGAELTTKSIVVKGYKKNGWNNFYVANDSLSLPIEGCYISMEWLNRRTGIHTYPLRQGGSQGYGQSLNLTREFSRTICCIRTNSGDWKKTRKIRWNGFALTDYNPSINVDIIY